MVFTTAMTNFTYPTGQFERGKALQSQKYKSEIKIKINVRCKVLLGYLPSFLLSVSLSVRPYIHPRNLQMVPLFFEDSTCGICNQTAVLGMYKQIFQEVYLPQYFPISLISEASLSTTWKQVFHGFSISNSLVLCVMGGKSP